MSGKLSQEEIARKLAESMTNAMLRQQPVMGQMGQPSMMMGHPTTMMGQPPYMGLLPWTHHAGMMPLHPQPGQYATMPPTQGQSGTLLVDAREFDALKGRVKELEKTTDVLAVGAESTQEVVRQIGNGLGVKITGMFKVSANSIKSTKAKPKKAITLYTISTPEGQKAYDEVIKDFKKEDLDPELAIVHALEAAEEADKEALKARTSAAPAAGASGGAAPSGSNARDEWQKLVNKHITINADLLAHAKNVSAVAARAKTIPALMLTAYKRNRENYGFGFNECIANPFVDPQQHDVDAFEAYKASVGLPAGPWDGTF